MKKVLFILVAVIMASCANTKQKPEISESKATQKVEALTAKARIGEFAKESDPITIDNVTMNGNIMMIDVTYGGGCKDHTFEIIGSPAVAKSFPGQRGIQLVHNANNDMCRALIRKTVAIDVSDLTDVKIDGNQIYYNLEGYEGRILHTYVGAKKK